MVEYNSLHIFDSGKRLVLRDIMIGGAIHKDAQLFLQTLFEKEISLEVSTQDMLQPEQIFKRVPYEQELSKKPHLKKQVIGAILMGCYVRYHNTHLSQIETLGLTEEHFCRCHPEFLEPIQTNQLLLSRFVEVWKVFYILSHVMKVSSTTYKSSFLVAANLISDPMQLISLGKEQTLFTELVEDLFHKITGKSKTTRERVDYMIKATDQLAPVTVNDIQMSGRRKRKRVYRDEAITRYCYTDTCDICCKAARLYNKNTSLDAAKIKGLLLSQSSSSSLQFPERMVDTDGSDST